MFELTKITTRNLSRMAHNVREVLTWATPEEHTHGADWYAIAHEHATQLAHTHGVSVDAAAGVIAALSPRVEWELNKRYADQLLETGTCPHMRDPLRKAQAIAQGALPLDVLGGNKVRAFYSCIITPHTADAVCVDRHAFDICAGRPTDDKFRKALERVGVYELVSEAYVTVARECELRPHQVQAITWTAWRHNVGRFTARNLRAFQAAV